MELHEKASAALSWFTTGERKSEDTGRRIVTTHDDTPDWVTDLCHEAHGEMFPDDWRYEFIDEALEYLANENDPDDYNPEPSIYTAELARWLASRADRMGYCDEAAEAFGSQGETTFDRIARGQWQEMSEVYGLVHQWLENADEDEIVARADKAEAK